MKKKKIVVDASIAVKWILKEADSSAAVALLTDWIDREDIELLAPTLLAYEVTNTLHRHIRKGELPFDDAKKGLKEIIFKVIDFEFSPDASLNTRAMELAQQFGLSAAYDAHYLAFAEYKGCELWTADTRFWNSIKGKLDRVRWMGDYPTPQDKEI
jgi:predicted nucleic acid-binding protein